MQTWFASNFFILYKIILNNVQIEEKLKQNTSRAKHEKYLIEIVLKFILNKILQQAEHHIQHQFLHVEEDKDT